MRSKRDRFIVGAIVVQIFLFAVIIGTRDMIQSAAAQAPKPQNVAVSATVAIGKTSASSTNSYWLVEFGDYECPPCAAASKRVDALLKEHPDLKFEFRQFPLKSLHKNAMAAALLAESARKVGKFREVHDALYKLNTDISAENLQQIAMAYNLSKPTQTEQQKINHDISDAQKVKVNGTPTFVLCLPTGEVVTLGSLDQVHDLVQ